MIGGLPVTAAGQQPGSPLEICLRTWNHVECGLRMLRGLPPFASRGPVFYFGSDEDTLSLADREALDHLAAAYAQSGENAPRIVITGYADTSGSASYNADLSQRRANAVRDYLVRRGVPAAGLATQAFGESRPTTDTADGVDEATNRRVELSVEPAPGSAPW